MRKFLKHITLLVLAGLFIISSTGVYLTIHNCSSENITELFFFTLLSEEPCEHHAGRNNEYKPGNILYNHSCSENGICHDNSPNCDGNCSDSAEMPECCSNTILYITVDDDFIKSDPSLIPLTCHLLHLVFTIDTINTGKDNKELSLITYIDPPPNLYGRGLTFFNRIILL